MLPLRDSWVGSLARGTKILHAAWPKKKKVFYSMIGYLLEKVTLMEDFTLQSFKE